VNRLLLGQKSEGLNFAKLSKSSNAGRCAHPMHKGIRQDFNTFFESKFSSVKSNQQTSKLQLQQQQ